MSLKPVNPRFISSFKTHIDIINNNINECIKDLGKTDKRSPTDFSRPDFWDEGCLEAATADRKYILAKIKQQRAALELIAAALEEEYVH